MRGKSKDHQNKPAAAPQKSQIIVSWLTCFRVMVAIFVLYLAITWWRPLAGLIWHMISAATPLFIGIAIAYVVNILMSKYEKWYFPGRSDRKWVAKSRRAVCLIGAMVTVLGAVVVLLLIIIPQLVNAITVITKKLPGLLTSLSENAKVMELLPETVQEAIHELDYNKLIAGIMNFLTNGATPADTTFTQVAGKSLTGMLGSFTSIFMTALLGFIFSIYILTGKEKLKRQFTRLSGAYLGDSWQNKAWPVLAVANECFHNYIVGQVVEAIIIGVLCAIGMWALRLPYAPMVGTVVGFTALIPVFGCYLGAAVGALMCLAVSPMKALIFLVFICILQQLEGNLIYPRVVGTSLGLPGIWVLAAVTVGGGMGGIVGMLLSVPLAATIYKLTSMDVRDRETEGSKRTTASDVVGRFNNEEKSGDIK